MSNLANIQKLYYCDKKSGNTGHCSNVATRQVKICSKSEPSDKINKTVVWGHRCEEHATTGTVSKKVFESNPFDQSFALQKINEFLMSLIGKNIRSKFHTARELEVKYLKENGGVMCFQNHSKKWKYVYYHQIEEVLEAKLEIQSI